MQLQFRIWRRQNDAAPCDSVSRSLEHYSPLSSGATQWVFNSVDSDFLFVVFVKDKKKKQ
jgi:hypothetical protein